MKKNLLISIRMTLATTVLLGIVYPLVVTGFAQMLFKDKANGQLISENGKVVGSRIIGQSFTSALYCHSRPSAAGSGYDAANSSASNLGPTNKSLIDRVKASVVSEGGSENRLVPVDLVTSSGSGLDPHISPAAAEFQVERVARERGIKVDDLRQLVLKHTEGRQLGFLGEARVNVLELNLELDEKFPPRK
jgi:K+-transporting ATPase ATPase C chain